MQARSAHRYYRLKPYKEGTHSRPSFSNYSPREGFQDRRQQCGLPAMPSPAGGLRVETRLGREGRIIGARVEDGPRGHRMKAAGRHNIGRADVLILRTKIDDPPTLPTGPARRVEHGAGDPAGEAATASALATAARTFLRIARGIVADVTARGRFAACWPLLGQRTDAARAQYGH
jgi:hypothetical protein